MAHALAVPLVVREHVGGSAPALVPELHRKTKKRTRKKNINVTALVNIVFRSPSEVVRHGQLRGRLSHAYEHSQKHEQEEEYSPICS